MTNTRMVGSCRPGAYRPPRSAAATGVGAPEGRAQGRHRLELVPGIGAEIVLTVDGELRKTRLFRSHEQAELVGPIADTRGRGGDQLNERVRK